MQLSYAQNLEDYHLSLLFADRPAGTYVDIGGGHPVADNVSFWFYLKGWRGLVVEPQVALAALYPHIRPRDAIEKCLVGASDGEAPFHVVERLHGFSTTVEAHAAAAGQFGAGYQTVTRPVRTLASLLAAHGVGRIDFLKIDVEGAEADVLAGGDWRRFRPEVVLIEAIAPGSMAEAWQGWEPMLTGEGYRFAYFDGLNRFYVAEEAAALAERLPQDKTPWDRVRHLYELGRAPVEPSHPDHALALALIEGFLAGLPAMPMPEIASLLLRSERFQEAAKGGPASVAGLLDGAAEYPGSDKGSVSAAIEELLATDRVRAALGRIAATYDGGQLLDRC
jgi:FkbM family methyltransferase